MIREKFIELTLGSHIVVHGYDDQNKEVVENVTVDTFSKKIININRIQSVSEKYILTDYSDGRWIYWEYKEDYKFIKTELIG